MILPFGITGSTHMWNSNNPSSRNYGINTCSRVPKSLDSFWTEVQGWYNCTTFLMTEVHWIRSEPNSKDDTILPPSRWPNFTGSILNQSSRMIQSYHIHEDWDLRINFELRFRDDAIHHFHGAWDLLIHFEPKFRDDAIPPHSRGPRPPDTFWTEVQGWCNPTTFMKTKVTGSILYRCPRMIQSLFILDDQGHRITSE